MTSLQFITVSSTSSRRAAPARSAQKPTPTAAARTESLLMRFVRSLAQARIDWATGGRV